MTRKQFKRLGAVVPLVAFSMTMLVGFVAVAVDGGLLLDKRQRVQAAADAAALAAASDLYLHYASNLGLDPKNTACLPNCSRRWSIAW